MAAGVWKFILTDNQGVVLGEILNATNRQVVLPLKSIPTVKFTVDVSNPFSALFTQPTWDGMVKAYRNNALQFVGPVVAGQEQGSSQGASVAVNAAGPFWRLNFRALGRPSVSGGTITPFAIGNSVTTFDLGSIAQSILTEANTQGYTGIDNGSLTASSSGACGPYVLQPAGDAIINLSVGVNSFEFVVTPREPTNVSQVLPSIGTFVVAPLISTVRSNIIFEYGAGAANVLSYSNGVDRSKRLNRGYMLQPAVTDNSDVLMSENTASQAAIGVYAGAVDSGGVEWDVYRQVLLDAHVSIRKFSQQILSFVPSPNAVWQPLVDYQVGDQVRCRVTQNGQFCFDAMFRVWGITFDIDQNGLESPTLQLVPS